MKYHDNIKRRRKELHMTQSELATAVGYNSKSTISKLESGGIDLSQSMLSSIAKALKTTPTSLLYGDGSPDFKKSENLPSNILPIETQKFPLLGSIACGEPIFAENHIEEYIEAGGHIHADFCLRAKGDSMINARICDGDIVFIRMQNSVDNGQIAAVLINDEATLKRVYYNKSNNILQLNAENPSYEPLIYAGDQLSEIRILGLAVAFQSRLIN